MRWCLSSCLLMLSFIAACQSERRPKPWGFPRIQLPEHQYRVYDNPNCPFVAEIPVYAVPINEANNDSCYLDLDFPRFDCRWHITIRDFRRENTDPFSAYEDYRRLVYQHTKKAIEIKEQYISFPNGIGTFFELYGEVPTSAQFFFSDSLRYAIITNFYFRIATKNDSLKPIIDYMKEDLWHFIKTVRWR